MGSLRWGSARSIEPDSASVKLATLAIPGSAGGRDHIR
jgi:hypothetical protein